MVRGTVALQVNDRFSDLKSSIAGLMNKTVLVGIPEEEATRDGGGEINNAELLYIHSQGSPLRGIERRPVIEPAIEANKEALGQQYGKAIKAGLDGNNALMESELDKTGQRAENFAKRWFEDERNNWPPLADSTIEARKRKGNNENDIVPLVDTGEMRKSITHVVRDK